MSNWFKRFWAFILTAILLFTAFPAVVGAQDTDDGKKDAPHVFTEADETLLENDVFAKIEAVTAPSSGGARKAPKRAPQTEADFAALIPQVKEAVETSDTYLAGTLRENDDVLTWETTVGIPCTYNPRMEAKLHGEPEEPSAEERAALEQQAAELKELASSIKKSPALRGPGAGSVKIGLIQPFWDSDSNYADANFRCYSPYYVSMWELLCGASGGEGLRYTMSEATVDNVAYALEECGIVIFDSHGDINAYYAFNASCNYLCLSTAAGITEADCAKQTDENGREYYNVVKGNGYVDVSGAALAAHMTKDAPGSLLYMGICYGMSTDKLHKPLREKGVACCWGYTQPVSFDYETKMMLGILQRVASGEYFGVAAEAAKKKNGRWDYSGSVTSESEARSYLVAFPICVSDEDPYPTGTALNSVQKVRSVWTLEPRDPEVIAVPDDEAHGSVSVSPEASYTYRITVTPASGWYPDGYTLESGSVGITKEDDFNYIANTAGNPSGISRVTMRFRKLMPCDVVFVADGKVVDTVSCREKDSITLPSAPEMEGWNFCGWTDRQIAGETTDVPAFYAPGKEYRVNGTLNLYAVYKMRTGYPERSFRLLTQPPVNDAGQIDWSGQYMITWKTGRYANFFVGAADGERMNERYKDLKWFSELGGIAIDPEEPDVFVNVPERAIFELENVAADRWSMKNVKYNNYVSIECDFPWDLYSYSEYNNTDERNFDWKFSMNPNGSVLIENFGGGNHFYFIKAMSTMFIGYNRTDPNNLNDLDIHVYQKLPFGYTYYTTGSAVTDWDILQQRINAAENGDTLRLQRNVTAAPGEGPLVIPAGKTITLSLLDCAIDRGLASAQTDGNAITVYGDLTLTGSGVIRGGNNAGLGGGVLISGSGGKFTLQSGSVTGNTARYGGGIAAADGGVCLVPGGSVTGNTARTDGGGVYADGGLFVLTEAGTANVFANTPNDIAPENDPDIFGYTILTEGDRPGCGVIASPAFAFAGDRVTLTPAPSEYFWFESMTAADAEGASVALTEEPDGTFTFTMPASVVTISTSFTPIPPVPTPAGSSHNIQLYKTSGLYVYSGIEHGTVSAKAVYGSATVPVSADGNGNNAALAIQQRTPFQLTVEPDPGYRLKKLIVESTDDDGAPDGRYHIPIEDDLTFVMDRFREGMLFFRVYAEFVEGPEVYHIDLYASDLSNAGNTVTADKTYASPGDTVTVRVLPAPGYRMDRLYVYYRSELYGRKDIETTRIAPDDPTVFTFTVPDDALQDDKEVNVTVTFARLDRITVDLGAGHEALALAYEGKDGYTVSGTKVTMPFGGGTLTDAENAVLNDLAGTVPDADHLPFTDNGERFVGQLGLKPAADYADSAAYAAEHGTWNTDSPAWNDVLCLIWEKPLQPGDIQICVKPPMRGEPASPVVTLTGHGELTAAESWHTSYDPSGGVLGETAAAIEEGTEYYTELRIGPSFGYYSNDLRNVIVLSGASEAAFATGGADARMIVAAAGVFVPVTLTVYPSSVDGEALTGPVVIHALQKGTTVGDALQAAGFADPDTLFTVDGYRPYGMLTPKPLGEYGSREALNGDAVDLTAPIGEDTVLYCPLVKQIDSVGIIVSVPVCGTSTATQFPDAPWTDQTDPPVIAVVQNADYAPNRGKSANAAWWLAPDATLGYSGDFTGEQSYLLGFSLVADFGCEFAADGDDITIYGGEFTCMLPDTDAACLEAVASVTAAHDFGEPTVSKAPTCVDNAEETWYCSGCAETLIHELAGTATGVHTYGEEGDARFTCAVCQQVDAERKAAAEAADQAAADQTAANEVIAKIDTIGEVEYTDECKAKIDAASDAYDALTDTQKALVTNYGILTGAIVHYNELKAAAETPTDPTDPTEPENPTEPTDPDHPSGDSLCKWDNVDHGTSFWGRIVRFFHSVLYFFAHLFGRR